MRLMQILNQYAWVAGSNYNVIKYQKNLSYSLKYIKLYKGTLYYLTFQA